MIARVIADINIPAVDRLFDYFIPDEELDTIEIGMRVIVPFGRQTRLGYVIELVESSEFATKTIIEVLDIIPSLDVEAFEYVKYLESINQSTLISILETILPKELFFKYQQVITVNNSELISKELLENLNIDGTTLYGTKLKEYKKEINKHLLSGSLVVSTIYGQREKEKYKEVVLYKDSNHYKNANKYEDLIAHVTNSEGLTKKEITNDNFSLSSINTLIKNNVFYTEKRIDERLVKFIETDSINNHILNSDQDHAVDTIINSIGIKDTYLLKGITGSGKTEVYMSVMKEVLNKNKTILYLVPEISLVAPLVQQLSSRFNEKITHYNGSLSKGERLDAYLSLLNNETKILVGTRSSSFLPLKDLGLIIVDEEQDSSYTQNGDVQYDVIDVLRIKADYHNALTILGSATPKVASYYKALNNEYKLLVLNTRATKQALPHISYIDMKEELNNGNTSMFSIKLQEVINNKLSKNEQVMLLYNRKGYASFTMCRNCGHTPKCKNCDVSLTYYKNKNQLVCRYCNHTEPNLTTCPSCNKDTIRPIGAGIDKVYEQTMKLFPSARVVKMDSESTRLKGSYERIWHDFNTHKYDILVGTKMITKGLDFPNVTLVGVMMADLEIKSPNYLSTEHAYATLTQVVGRSGRHLNGEAIIQGYDLNNFAIKAVATNYDDFYKEAIYQRQISKYEPFYLVRQLLISNESYLEAYKDANNIKKELSKHFEIVLGPTEPFIKYVNNKYRVIITIKDKNIIDNELILKTINYYKNNSKVEYHLQADII